MAKIKRTVWARDVYWDMRWNAQFQVEPHNKPPVERMFEAEKALAILLMNEVIFLNSFWWKHGRLEDKGDGKLGNVVDDPDARWTKEESRLCSVNVNCNDVFAWGTADAEELPYDGIQSLYDAYLKDPHWGPAVWCIRQRKQMPQKPVEKRIREGGIWDMDEIEREIAS